MVTFDEFVKRFVGLEAFVKKEGQRILLTKGKDIVDMVKDQQHDGLNADDKIMQTGYSTGYSKRRKKKGLQTRFVDLHFSGKFHNSLKVVPSENGVDVVSGLDYEKYLRGNFPNNAGLTKANAEKEAEVIANILAPIIKKYLVA